MTEHVTEGEIVIAQHDPLRPVRSGIHKRVIVDLPELAVDEYFFDAGVATTTHGHGESQGAYQVSGRFEVTLGTQIQTLGPGDGYSIPATVEHSVRCIEKGSYVLVTARQPAGASDHGHHHGPGGHAH